MVSVTQILDTFPEKELVDWQLRDPKKAKQVSEEAKLIGSEVDLLVRRDIQGFDAPFNSTLTPSQKTAISNCLHAWQRFKEARPHFVLDVKDCQAELIDGEVVGHPDFIVQEANRWGIVDLKCAGQIRPTHWTQVAAYSLLKQGSGTTRPDFLGILRLDKVTSQPEYQELTNLADMLYEQEVWNAYLALYRHRERVKQRAMITKEDEAYDALS